MSSLFLLLSVSFLFLPLTSAARFACTAKNPATCQSLVGYVPANATTLASVRVLFQLRSFRSLLAANSLPLNTPQNYTVPALSTVRIRFPCSCSGGSGSSFGLPVYKVRPGDSLDGIARGVFAGLVTYEEIAKANNISDRNRIEVDKQIKVCFFLHLKY
jgi:LysM domain